MDGQHSGLTHYMFSKVLNSIKDRAETLGYDITFISENIGGKETSYLEHARYRRCDGVIITCIDFDRPSVHELIASNLPVVVIDHDFNDCGVVASDNEEGMKQLVTYLYDKGFKDLLYIHGEDCDVTKYRVKSFKETCGGYDDTKCQIMEGIYYSKSSAYDNTKEYLESDKPTPSVIMYPDDYAAIGGMRAIRELGYKIPDDIAIVGYDGIELGALVEPSITTIEQDTDQIGIEAVNILKRLMENKDLNYERVLVPVKLVERSSTRK